MENSRRITSNFLFGNTSSSYDFGLMAQTGIDQSVDNANVSNNNFTFIQATQRSKYEFIMKTILSLLYPNCLVFSLATESGNDGTWLTVFGFRTSADARTLIDEFSRLGVIEKYVV